MGKNTNLLHYDDEQERHYMYCKCGKKVYATYDDDFGRGGVGNVAAFECEHCEDTWTCRIPEYAG